MPFYILPGIIVCSFLSPSGLLSQNVYKRPHEVINETVLADAEAELSSDNPEADRTIRELSEELAKYTSQFVEYRSIADERRYESLNYKNINPDTSRLIASYRKRKYDRTYYFGESPFLMRIHRSLGLAWEKMGKKQKAVQSYMTSLRYSSFEPKCSSETVSEAQYEVMAKSFADADRIAQSQNDGDSAGASEARELILAFASLKRRYDESIRRVDTARARAVRGIPGESEAEALQNRDRLKSEFDISVERLNSLYKNSYLPFCQKRRGETGQIIYRIARISKEISETVESANLKNYADMLEFAHSLDERNPVYLDELIKYYKNTGNKKRAIDLNETLISVMEMEKSDLLPEQYFRIAGLYSDTRNFILSAESYEKFYALENNAAIKSRAFIPLADLHFRRTGNLDRALELYEAYQALPEDERKYPYDLMGKEVRYDSFVKTAAIYRRKQRTDKENQALSEALEIFRNLENEKIGILKEKNELQIQINDLKKNLFNEDEDTDELRRYYRLLRIDMPRVKKREEQYRIRLDALHVQKVLERLAVLARYERNFNRAVEMYTEIIRRGRGKERDRARVNIERIQLTMKDGFYRDPVLPPDFER
ncbi:MAG: hypothetical protein OEZ34_08355 [Spirochaetia bacterium]|nr:hypothetical protein [Spirochaetia bacterium]